MRFLVADDHALIRRLICGVLEDEDGWQICAEAADGVEAVETAVALNPDVALLDLSMPVMNGLEAAKEISSRLPGTLVLILTCHASQELEKTAIQSGAKACLPKTDLHCLPGEVRSRLKLR